MTMKALVVGFQLAVILTGISSTSVPVAAQSISIEPIVSNEPGSPLPIVYMRSATVPTTVPAQMAERMASFEIAIQNASGKSVMAYAIRYSFKHDNGSPAGSTCGAAYSFGVDKPSIGAAETKILKPNLNRSGSKVQPVIDLVLLADGSYFGANSCQILEEYQHALSTRRATEQYILNYLVANGPEKTTSMLRETIQGQKATDKLLLQPKKR